MKEHNDLNARLKSIADLFNHGSVIYEAAGKPVAVSGLGDVSVASMALGMELAATSHDHTEAMDVLVRHKQHDPDTFELVMYGAVLNLLALHLEPAFRLLDGTSTDRRARAVKDWKAVKEASGS